MVVALAIDAGDIWQTVEDPETLREAAGSLIIALLPLFVAAVAIASLVHIWRELRRDPLVLSGRTVEKIEKGPTPGPYAELAIALRLVEGLRWKIHISRACRLGGDGVLSDGLRGDQDVRLTRKLYRELRADEQVVLLCTPGGRGFEVLSHWPSWAHLSSDQNSSARPEALASQDCSPARSMHGALSGG
jgi:hypothetical protein